MEDRKAYLGNNYKDYYEILGVKENASIAEINKAYKALALKMHPDKAHVAKDVPTNVTIEDINEAHKYLHDKNERELYDEHRRTHLRRVHLKQSVSQKYQHSPYTPTKNAAEDAKEYDDMYGKGNTPKYKISTLEEEVAEYDKQKQSAQEKTSNKPASNFQEKVPTSTDRVQRESESSSNYPAPTLTKEQKATKKTLLDQISAQIKQVELDGGGMEKFTDRWSNKEFITFPKDTATDKRYIDKYMVLMQLQQCLNDSKYDMNDLNEQLNLHKDYNKKSVLLSIFSKSTTETLVDQVRNFKNSTTPSQNVSVNQKINKK